MLARGHLASLLLLTIGCLSSCSSRAPASSSSNNTAVANNTDGWFCQLGESKDAWDCVQDEVLSENPQPTRLPAPPQPELPPDLSVPSTDAPVVEPPANGSTDEASPERETLETTSSTVDPSLPPHIALAYRPERATAIQDLPADLWAVQLVAVSTREALESYAERYQLVGMTAVRIAREGEFFYVLLLGLYETEALARQAVKSLPPLFSELDPWVRPLGSLQEAIRAGDELAGGPLQG